MNFSETLDSLMFEREINSSQLAKCIGVDATTVMRYLRGLRTPSVATLVKLADYFNCSTDFLLGRESENYPAVFLPCPPFAEQLKILKARLGCNWCDFYKDTAISSSRFYEWKNGNRIPTLDCVVMLADKFGRTVDFIIGRTKN